MPADRRPILLFTFANDRQDGARYLRNLPEEARQVEAALAQAQRICEPVLRQNVTPEQIEALFAGHPGRVAVFHFLLFSSYLGGSGNDDGYGLALDSAGNAYVGGQTSSTNFPTTPGAYQATPGSGFVLKIDPPGGAEATVPRHPHSPAAVATRPAHPAVPRRYDVDVVFGLLSDPLERRKGRQL
jgi:hypothetical protein